MNALLALLILAAESPAPSAEGASSSVVVFQCDFEEATDRNFDGWPDNWTRRRGKGYPDYVKIGIAGDEPRSPEGGRYLRVELDGGAAAVYSPPLPVSPSFSYLLEASLRARKLRHNVAGLSLSFLDAAKRPLVTHSSRPFGNSREWQSLSLGPITTGETAAFAIVGLWLRPTAKADLVGTAEFDNLRLSRLPRFSLDLNAEHHLYVDAGKVEATCRASGLMDKEPLVEFELVDAFGQVLATASRQLALAKDQPPDDAASAGHAGTAAWRPPIPGAGFYRVRSRLASRPGTPLERSATLAVVRHHAAQRGGPFGWSLPRGDAHLPLKSLVALLAQSGASQVKFPVWYREEDVARADELAWFAERLGNLGIELVGVLDQPPLEDRERFGGKEQMPIASVFVKPALWQPLVDPVMSRLGLKVKWWQLGADDDLSFVGYPGLEKRVAEIRQQLERLGQEIQIVLPWNGAYEPLAAKSPPWTGLSYRAEPSFTAGELAEHLAATRKAGQKHWVMLQPLARSSYSVEARARDLVDRMLAAKVGRADGAFVPDPFDAEHGLLNADGTPAELLLPWRTTAQMISSAEYLGRIELPGGSSNYVFARQGEAVLVVWNERPTRETLYLGENVKQIDIWGRESTPAAAGHEQIIEVGYSPVFVTGVHLAIAKWRLAFNFDTPELESNFGRDQQVAVKLRNTFDQGVGGEIRLMTPPAWQTTPSSSPFKAAADEEISQRFLILLKPDADTGDQPVRIDFALTADRDYKFSVYRKLRVGLGDITLEAKTRLNDEGSLVVEQLLENTTDRRVSFNCYLFAPERKRQRSQIFEQGRGRITKSYLLPDGEDLVGQTLWLRAEEINGPRILNFRVNVER